MNEEELIKEIVSLRALLRAKEARLAALRREKQISQPYGLNNDEIIRYSRQLFLPEIGVEGQKKIKNASILIVGAGGLGCPAGLYLAAAGIGHIGVIDYDDIESSNIHRQILYTEDCISIPKVIAFAEQLNRINSYVKITPHKILLNSSNALEIIRSYDIVLDATDNVATRYLLNDACVLSKKPLISGSALRFEGHLSVFNCKGPCYRCIFPVPAPPETVTNCGDGGVIGPAVGVIGVLQALEALKIILGISGILSGRFLVFDGTETKFRNINLRSKNPTCAVCSTKPLITQLIDYEMFCGAKACDKNPNLKLLKNEERLTVTEYYKIMSSNTQQHVLIDVRAPEEFQICHLDNSINVPFKTIKSTDNIKLLKSAVEQIYNGQDPVHVYVLCRRGNDSQKAVQYFKNQFEDNALLIKDIIGGIHAWSKEVNSTFPVY